MSERQGEQPPTQEKPAVRVTLTGAARARARAFRIAGVTLGCLACALSLALGTAFGHFYWNSGAFGEALRAHGWQMAGKILTGRSPLEVWTPEEQFRDRSSINVLVLGVDHDYDNKARVLKTHGRSDSILIARVDFASKRISALTIPRDTAVRIPGHRGIHKINAAHQFGGPELTIETIRSVFGVQADAAVTINFEGFQKLVDAIGGIDINVEKRLKYDDNWGKLHINLYPGYQHLNGYQAMGYVRMRHSDSDLHRSRRQHAFLEAMRTKIKQPGTFLRLPKAADTLVDSLKTFNLTRDQMYALANFARSLPKEAIVIETLPSFEGPSYVSVDADRTAEVIRRLFYPNQMVALGIDAPDPDTVRSMNRRYARGGRRRSGARREKPEAAIAVPASETAVEPPAAEDNGATSPEPPAEQAPAPGGSASGSEDDTQAPAPL